jgi:putative transcriptional regulator
MSQASSLKNHFLIASPSLHDPNFSRTVTFICEHNDEGALGIVINRPSQLQLHEVYQHMEMAPPPEEGDGQRAVFIGGPVQGERGFVLHEPLGNWVSTLAITDELGLTTSRDILESMARAEGPRRTLVALGYAGWGGGQLEEELQTDAWISGPADSGIIFDLPAEERWEAAASLLGIDLSLFTSTPGHA